MALAPPPGLNLNDDAQTKIVGSLFTTWTLAVIAVLLRFVSRKIAKAGFWVDDWLMLPALIICTLLTFVAGVWQIQHGLGKHIYVVPNQSRSVVVNLQSLFIAELCYTGAIMNVKFSILALYWRLFKLKIKIPIYIIGAVVFCWGMAVFLITVLQCFPLRGFWDKSVPAKCGVDDYLFFYGNSIPNIITDFALLGLPLPCIWKLKVPLSQKFSLSGMFVLGGFVVAVGIVRLKVLLDINAVSPDITWSLWPSQLWTTIELNTAVLSGCLPSLRPILNLAATLFGTSTSSRSTEAPQGTNRNRLGLIPWSQKNSCTAYSNAESSIKDDRRPFARLTDDRKEPPDSRQKYELRDIEVNDHSIQVQKQVDVEWQEAS